jgi:hypothetical protein
VLTGPFAFIAKFGPHKALNLKALLQAEIRIRGFLCISQAEKWKAEKERVKGNGWWLVCENREKM